MLALLFLTVSCDKKEGETKILFIATNVSEMKSEPNSTYLIELAVPFNQFSKKGFELDIVSPKGVKIPIHHSGDATNVVKFVIKNELFKNKTENSLKPTEIKCSRGSSEIDK